MGAPEGNQFWKLRQSHGRDLEYETPDLMRKEIEKYFQWCDDHPWYKNEAVKSGEKVGEIIKVPTARPYTIGGICIYLGISMSTWKMYCGRQDFSNVTKWAEEVCRTQKFEGAAVGAFNANIIARDLALPELSEITGKGGKPLNGPPVVIKMPEGTEINFPTNTDGEE